MNAIKILPQLFPSITEAPPGSNFPFSPGNEIQATVLRIVDSRHVLLQLQNRQILAEANAALPAGETLRLIVEETRPNVILRLLDPGNAPGNLLPLLLKKGLAGYFSAGREGSIPLLAKRPEGGGPVLLHPKLEPLLHFLKETALGSRFGEMREALGKILRGSGIFFENKIAQLVAAGQEKRFAEVLNRDLKGLLTRIAAGSAENPSEVDLMQRIEHSLQKIELFQLLNLKQGDTGENVFFCLPLWAGERMHLVEMNLSLPGKDREQDRGTSLLFLLSLPALGTVKIEASLRDKDLFCRIFVCRAGVEGILREALPELEGRLAALGFRPQIRVLRESEEEIRLSWVRDLEYAPDGSFTVRV